MSQKLSSTELRIQLMSSDESIALNAIEQLKINGKASAISPLLEVLASSSHESMKKEAREMLSAMRVKNAEEELVQALFDEKFKSIQVEILQFLWSNGFSAAGQLHVLVEVAVKNGFQTSWQTRFQKFVLVDKQNCQGRLGYLFCKTPLVF